MSDGFGNVRSPSRREFNFLQAIVIGVLMVVTVLVTTILIDYYAQKQATYLDLSAKIQESNIKIESLEERVKEQKTEVENFKWLYIRDQKAKNPRYVAE